MSLEKLKCLSPFQQRKAAALLGALVADAAVAPLHWIYDQGKVADLIKTGRTTEFYPTTQCPYYIIPVGNNSTYGDQLFVTLKHIAQNKGFDGKKLQDALFETFGPGTEYEKARLQSGSPVKGPWTNHCLKIMIAKRENGDSPAGDTNSKDPDGLCKAVALAGLLDSSDKASLNQKVKECVQTAQLNPMAADFAVGGFGIVENVIRTGSVDLEALKDCGEVGAAIKLALDSSEPLVKAAKGWGLGCGFPASFTVAAYGIKCAQSYTEAVRDQIRAAGDNCSRVILVAATCGARYGLDAIPEDWLKKYSRTEEALGYIETVVQL